MRRRDLKWGEMPNRMVDEFGAGGDAVSYELGREVSKRGSVLGSGGGVAADEAVFGAASGERAGAGAGVRAGA